MKKFKKYSINKIQLRSRKLILAWQHNYFKDTKIKSVDGYFIASNIFSVYVYSTNKNSSVTKELSMKIDTKISQLIANSRAHIKQEQQKLDRMTTSMIGLPLIRTKPMVINVNTEKISPSVLALIKLYIAIDKHILSAYQATTNGDIGTTQCDAFTNEAFRNLYKLLSDIQRITVQFHKIRKENS